MDPRRALAGLLAVLVVTAGLVAASRGPDDGDGEDSPRTKPPSRAPLAPALPSDRPTPTVTPTPMLTPSPGTACTDAVMLPVPTADLDVREEGGSAAEPVSGGGRIWFSVMAGDAAPHAVGVDTASGATVRFPVKDHTTVVAVTGDRAWLMESLEAAVLYDVRTRREVRRWDRTTLFHGSPRVALTVRGLAADATGGWLLGWGNGGSGDVFVVVRVGNDGSTRWATQLKGPFGGTNGPADSIVVHDGNAYVGMHDVDYGRPAFWRVAPDGRSAVRRGIHPGVTTGSATQSLAAGPDGLYATLNVGGDVRVARLDPDDLRMVAWHDVMSASSPFVLGRSVYVTSIVCNDHVLVRLDARTMRRTGEWFVPRDQVMHQGTAHQGAVWLLHLHNGGKAVALRRYTLP